MALARTTVEPLPAFAAVFADAAESAAGAANSGIGGALPSTASSQQGIPTSRAEDWKYTNVVKAANVPLLVAQRAEIGLDAIGPYLLGGHKARRLIFVNGHIVPELSHVAEPATGRARHEPAAGRSQTDQRRVAERTGQGAGRPRRSPRLTPPSPVRAPGSSSTTVPTPKIRCSCCS